jgi:ABC-2 type transport system permease protein
MVSAVDVALIAGIGRLFGVPFPTHWPAITVALVLGAASFCALGVAVASLIRNSEAAPAVVQLGPFAQHTGFDWANLGVLLAWGTAGALIAVRRFRWDLRPE